MNYLEIRIDTRPELLEAVNTELISEGITDMVIDDPAVDLEMAWHVLPSEYVDQDELMEGQSRQPGVTVYLESTEDGVRKAIEVHRRIRALGEACGEGSIAIHTELRSDDEWKDNWKEFFKPVRIGDHIVVQPSWEAYEPYEKGDIVLSIDPGMAFGTGSHETTSIAARLIEKYLERGARFLDVGCGTGILSILAVRLGAKEALGVDIDPEAVKASAENFILNGVEKHAEVRIGDLTEGIGFQADFVAANLLTNLVIDLTPSVPAHLNEGGIYVSSGILMEHEERVRDCLRKNGFEVIEVLSDGDWIGFAARKEALK